MQVKRPIIAETLCEATKAGGWSGHFQRACKTFTYHAVFDRVSATESAAARPERVAPSIVAGQPVAV